MTVNRRSGTAPMLLFAAPRGRPGLPGPPGLPRKPYIPDTTRVESESSKRVYFPETWLWQLHTILLVCCVIYSPLL